MRRDLIVLADGTGNSAAKAFKTNVWRLYQALDLTDGSQIAMFGDGVGTSTFKPVQLLGLALGVGVKRNVLKLYKFLCLNYSDGDRIWGFGFSRGAFTIRVLAGLIHHEGLVSFRSEAELNRAAIAAYRAYRRRAFATKLPWVMAGRAVRDWIIAGWNYVSGTRAYHAIKQETFERKRHIINIHFIGVWDTVAAYGLPVDELTQAVDKWVWPMSFRDTSLLTNVQNARHALSLDDERRTFFPIPWNETDERNLRAQDSTIAADRLLQVWFAGVHANVGGGYPDDGLAHVALGWMIDEARKKGLRFQPWAIRSYAALAAPTGRLYDSRAGSGAFYRYQPRDAQALMGEENRPLVHGSVVTRMAHGNDGYAPISLPHDVNVLPPYGPAIGFDAAAAERARSSPVSPPQDPSPAPDRDKDQLAKERAQLLDDVVQLSRAAGPDDRAPLVALVLDTVWWRRVVYFVSLSFALIAAAYPVLEQYLRIDGVTDRVNVAVSGTIDWATGLVKGFLPGFAEPWLVALVDSPAAAAFVLSALGISLAVSGLLQQRIRDRARAAWRVQAQIDGLVLNRLRLSGQRRAAALATVVFGLLLLAAASLKSPTWLLIVFGAALFISAIFFLWRIGHDPGNVDAAKPGFLLNLARNLRTSIVAVGLYRWVARTAVPALFLAGIILFVAAVAHRAVFDGMNTAGHYCKRSTPETTQPQEKLGTGATFPTNAVCHPTGLTLIEGRRYRIILTMQDEWFDKGIRTDVGGFAAESARHYAASPLKRWWFRNWFQPVARIGELGNYEYVLEPAAPLPVVPFGRCRPADDRKLSVMEAFRDTPVPVSAEMRNRQLACEAKEGLRPSRVLISDIKAGATGELFIYVNDAVLLWPGLTNVFYRNNTGTATVQALRIRADAVVTDD